MIQNLTNISKTIIISSMTLVIISLLFSPYEVNGRSMQPTLEDGDKVLVLRLNYINLPIIDQKIIRLSSGENYEVFPIISADCEKIYFVFSFSHLKNFQASICFLIENLIQ